MTPLDTNSILRNALTAADSLIHDYFSGDDDPRPKTVHGLVRDAIRELTPSPPAVSGVTEALSEARAALATLIEYVTPPDSQHEGVILRMAHDVGCSLDKLAALPFMREAVGVQKAPPMAEVAMLDAMIVECESCGHPADMNNAEHIALARVLDYVRSLLVAEPARPFAYMQPETFNASPADHFERHNKGKPL